MSSNPLPEARSHPEVLGGIMSMWWSTLATLVLGFITISVSARALSEEHFGVYFLLLTIVYLLQVISSLGMRASAARSIASTPDRHEQARIVGTVMAFWLLTTVAVSIAAILAKPVLLLAFSSDLLASLFIYVPLVYCIQSCDLLLDSIMQGFQLYRQMALARLVTSTLNLALVVLFLPVLHLGIDGLILARALAQVAVIALRFRAIPVSKRPRWDRALLRRLIRFGLPLQGNEMLTFVSQRLDVLILGAMASPAAVAYLGVATKIPQNFQRLFESLYAVYYPYMAGLFGRGEQAEAERSLNRFLRLATFVTAGSALATVLFQREIVRLVFSEKYLDSAPALGLLMIVFTISVASTILDYALMAAGHSDYMPVISFANTGPSALANVILIPLRGFMGAVYAKGLANIVSNPVSVWALRRETIDVRVSAYLKPMAIMAVCLAGYYGLGWDSVLAKSAVLGVFVVLCTRFSVVTFDDISTFAGNMRITKHRPAYEE